MPVFVSCLGEAEKKTRTQLPPRVVKAMAERMLRALRLSSAELSVVLVDDREIHTLNREHRDKDRPTDVLAFSQNEDEKGRFLPFDARAEVLLGDVVISLDTAKRQARTHGHPLDAEVAMLLAHGLLHLLGRDHQSDAEERWMKAFTQPLAHAGRVFSGSKRSRDRVFKEGAIASSKPLSARKAR